jgi:hypothetical protein
MPDCFLPLPQEGRVMQGLVPIGVTLRVRFEVISQERRARVDWLAPWTARE